jgi:hypothetical protein
MHPKKIARVVTARDVTRGRMLRARPMPAIAALTIRVNGSRAIKDVDLATLLGISLLELYKRIGGKLWRFAPTFYCELSDRYDRGRPSTQSRLAFFHGGAIALAGMVCGSASFQMGVDVAHALRNYRRASSQKQRRTRRDNDPVELDRYHKARARLRELSGGHLHSRRA